jgi:hypothetical protein
MGNDDAMTKTDVVRACARAYETRDRSLLEQHLADELLFFAPPDPGIDRATYFERCWPNSEHIKAFEYVRLFEHDGEVVSTYEATRADGSKFRNTEIHGFTGDQVSRIEVYFGWDLT